MSRRTVESAGWGRRRGAKATKDRRGIRAAVAFAVLAFGIGLGEGSERAVAAAPSLPAACGAATTASFANTTQTPIGGPLVTSTIDVSGAGTFLYDVNVTTHLTHSFSADLDVTLRSPAGTVVTLTTDNAGGNDAVFDGTVWDDDADPDGQVPYTVNPGMVTEHSYANGVLASPLTPEEPLAALVGEDPNGTWILTIVDDDTLADVGSLGGWSLDIATLGGAPAVTTAAFTNPTSVSTTLGAVTSTIDVSGAGTSLFDVDVTTSLWHSFSSDLDVTLQSPAGTVVTLSTDNATKHDFVFNGTVWDDDADPDGQVPYADNPGMVTDHPYVNLVLASPLTPEEPLAAFIGEDPNGIWTLTIVDDLAGDDGSLNGWLLDVDTTNCGPDLSVTKDDGVSSVTAGGSTVYSITASNSSPVAASGVSVTDTFPAGCASVSWSSTAAGGATGNTASGTGNIAETGLVLPAGGSVTYRATCAIAATAVGTLSNTASVLAAADPDVADNSATDSNTIVQPTAVAVSSQPNPSVFGEPVTFTALVTAAGGVPDGSVRFEIGGVVQTVALVAGSATLTMSDLAVGSHAGVVFYEGTSSFAASTGELASAQVVNTASTADLSVSKFVPVPPSRVFDTREPGPVSGYVAAGATRTVQFGGVAGVPTDGVTAVAFNLTITESGGPGFVTAHPHGDPLPLTSNLNTVRAGQTVPNLVIVPLGEGGRIDFYTLTGGHLLADVVGYFQQAPVASDGRIKMLDPQRMFDTRQPGPLNGKVQAGETLTFDVTGTAGVPNGGVSAVIMNVTATQADAAGYVTAFGGGPVPLASTLNFVEAGATTSNLAIVPVAPDGTVSFFTLTGTHLLADVMGYVTDATAPVSTEGLFVPMNPYRVFDTRNDQGPPLAAGTTIEREMTAAIARRSSGVWVNLTGTQVGGPSYVTGWRSAEVQPVTSNLNFMFTGETRANAALLPHSPTGSTSYFTLDSAHLLADAYGYVLAPPPSDVTRH